MDVTIVTDSNTYNVTIDRMTRLETILEGQGIPCPFVCNGEGTCGKCRVKFLTDAPKPTASERKLLGQRLIDRGYRLACEVVIIKDCKIYVPDESKVQSVQVFDTEAIGERARIRREKVVEARAELIEKGAIESNTQYGIAIDLGTTSIAIELFDCMDGNVLYATVTENHQSMYGVDVESRIDSSIRGRQYELSDLVTRDILSCLKELSKQLPEGVLIKDLPIVLVGNTAMIHMLCNMSCQGLSEPPYKPEDLSSQEIEIDDGIFITTFPAISAFIGGDIVSAIYALDIDRKDEINVLIDLGTNGEMVVNKRGELLASNIAMGPAFEGGNISCGCASVSGAIRSVDITNGFCKVTTIDNAYALGVCGSGVIEAVYEFFKNGIIDEHGTFSSEYALGYELCQLNKKQSVVFLQDDVRKMQLAKAAIRASIDVLLDEANISYGEIDNIYLSGGFAYRTAVDKLIGIGALPKAWKNRVIPVGNAALEGARQFIMENDMSRLERIISDTKVIDISSNERYQDMYLNNVLFEEK